MRTIFLLMALLSVAGAQTYTGTGSYAYLDFHSNIDATAWPACTSNRGLSCRLGWTLMNVTRNKILGTPGFAKGEIGPTVSAFRVSVPCGTTEYSVQATVVDGSGHKIPRTTSYLKLQRLC